MVAAQARPANTAIPLQSPNMSIPRACVILVLVSVSQGASQYAEFPDGAAARLTVEGAAQLAELPLRCIDQEYPNKTAHVIEGPSDARLTPRQLHPAFYGCFDWHSSVHGHWTLVRLLRSFPEISNRAKIREALAGSFSKENLAGEVEYFAQYEQGRLFERTYGWAWLLKLDGELRGWDDPQGREWSANMRPLTAKIVELWSGYLPKQTYPNRTGVHPNTAFGLVFALDWARSAADEKFAALIVERGKDYYLRPVALAATVEPDGTDFLSPSLEVADLMRRILPPDEFASWFSRYLAPDGLANVSKPPIVSDRSDYQIVHLDGLMFSRAWCLRGIGSSLPESDARRASMISAADELLREALPHLANGEYGGEHWLASFALYSLGE